MESENIKEKRTGLFCISIQKYNRREKSYYVFLCFFFWEIKMCSEPDTIGIFKRNIHPKVKFIYFLKFSSIVFDILF